jgi:hypothetical protein
VEVSATGVFNKLQQMKENASTGTNGVQEVVLKRCAATLAQSLTRLFKILHPTGCACEGMKDGHALEITRAQRFFNRAVYSVGGTERILGVHDSGDLKWNAHTDIAHSKAAKMIFLQQETFNVPQTNKQTILNILILTYLWGKN